MTYLVAVDDSECSTAAVRHAAEMAQTHAADVRLVHAVTPRSYVAAFSPAATDQPASVEAAEEHGRGVLAAAADRLRSADVTVAGTHLRYGDPTKAILRLVREHAITEIIVGHRDRSPASDRLLGSVAVELSEQTDTPVTIVD